MNLFVYGTLLVPEILEAVTRMNNLNSVSGMLSGYRIYRVEGGDFPGISKGDGSVPGRVLLNVPELAMIRLDAYEDTFYVRETVEIETDSGLKSAFAYTVPSEIAASVLSDETWTLDWFQQEALTHYWARLFQ